MRDYTVIRYLSNRHSNINQMSKRRNTRRSHGIERREIIIRQHVAILGHTASSVSDLIDPEALCARLVIVRYDFVIDKGLKCFASLFVEPRVCFGVVWGGLPGCEGLVVEFWIAVEFGLVVGDEFLAEEVPAVVGSQGEHCASKGREAVVL